MLFNKIRGWLQDTQARVVLTWYGLDQETISRVIDSDSSNAENDIAKLRKSHHGSLVGTWTTADHNFAMLMGERLDILSDGTGTINDKYDTVRFEWRQERDYEIQFRVIGCVTHNEGELNDESEDGEYLDWETVPYAFAPLSTSVGVMATLVELDGDGEPMEGFWRCTNALM